MIGLISTGLQRVSFGLDMSQLVYHGERSTDIEYLTIHGWQVNSYPAREMYARNGLRFLECDDFIAAFADASYISATLR